MAMVHHRMGVPVTTLISLMRSISSPKYSTRMARRWRQPGKISTVSPRTRNIALEGDVVALVADPP